MGQVVTVGLDLAKPVFQVHGVDGTGEVVVRRRLRRGQLLAFFAKLPACLIGMDGWVGKGEKELMHKAG